MEAIQQFKDAIIETLNQAEPATVFWAITIMLLCTWATIARGVDTFVKFTLKTVKKIKERKNKK